ncbi:hypothetical protein M4951_01795 [Blastopirellula sp. J2-11]|uniref:hypothetical protein n=1 Tax=Blastopirellula sp. J2-11 TaxID=2943192 RepID=UPI0021C8F172|nr:hypothetical protein [Blastopirellula sp. J2-11]UUO07057.1 hypothetical protein M4951_01795 [Blastopirellula sp. J2-11]
MKLDEKFRQQLQTLLEKTKRNAVKWNKIYVEDEETWGGYRALEFAAEVSFGDSTSIRIVRDERHGQPDVLFAELRRNEQPVFRVSAEDGTTDEAEQQDWKLLQQVYEEVLRVVTQWDKAIDVIDKALSSDSVVGLDPEPEIKF